MKNVYLYSIMIETTLLLLILAMNIVMVLDKWYFLRESILRSRFRAPYGSSMITPVVNNYIDIYISGHGASWKQVRQRGVIYGYFDQETSGFNMIQQRLNMIESS